MTSSRERILQSIRQQSLPEVPLPELCGPWIEFDDLAAQFLTMLQSVGGRGDRCGSREEALRLASQLAEARQVRRAASLAGPWEAANLDLPSVSDPHELSGLDLLVAEAEFAVAENGALWVVDGTSGLQAAYFLAEHLVMLCRASEIVPHLHAAYQRIDVARHAFGFFLSGPSKTADIEQSLVIGAQGPRSLQVFLYD